MSVWSEARKTARFNYVERKIKRLLSRQFECPMCGREGNVISLWGHSISKGQDCPLYDAQDPTDRLRTLVMMTAFGIPVPDQIRSDLMNDLLGQMDMMEILAQPELAALVVVAGLGMPENYEDHVNAQEPPPTDGKVPLGEDWDDWDKGATDDRDHSDKSE